MSEKPGVMLYFSIRKPLSFLTMEQRGELFTAVLDYSADGKKPSFDDIMLRMAWGFIVPSLDADDQRYEEKRLKRRYAAYCREVHRKDPDAEPLSFAEWMEQNHHVISCDDFDDQKDPVSVSDSVSISNSIPVSVSVSDTSALQPATPTEEEFCTFCDSLSIPADKAAHYRAVVKGRNWKETIKRFWAQDKSTYRSPKNTTSPEFELGPAEIEAIKSLQARRSVEEKP